MFNSPARFEPPPAGGAGGSTATVAVGSGFNDHSKIRCKAAVPPSTNGAYGDHAASAPSANGETAGAGGV
jgi:hypothetical protein